MTRSLAPVAISFLQLSDEFFHVALDDFDIVIGKIAPPASDVAFNLGPFSLQNVLVHQSPLSNKSAFRRSLVKEAPYFHVWFELDGGLGHIVEVANRWPKGDLFAREVIGGMLDVEPDVVKRQGRWNKGTDPRVERFRKRWRKFDWTRVLTDG